MSIVKLTDANFPQEAVEVSHKQPVLVDFWAEWCGPCHALMPVLNDVATELADQVKVVKVNIDENPLTPGYYNVRSIPTLVLLKDGEALDVRVGGMSKEKMIAWIKDELS